MAYYDEVFYGLIRFDGSALKDEDGEYLTPTKEQLERAKEVLRKIKDKLNNIEGCEAGYDVSPLDFSLPKEFAEHMFHFYLRDVIDNYEVYKKEYVLNFREHMRHIGNVKSDVEDEDGIFHDLMLEKDLRWTIGGMGTSSFDSRWVFECCWVTKDGAENDYDDDDGGYFLSDWCTEENNRLDEEYEKWWEDEEEEENDDDE